MHYQTTACKICGYDSHFIAAADANINCLRMPLPASGELVPYYHCNDCGFIFTPAFDAWTPEQFQRRIYNDDYVRIDPEFASVRPLRQADVLAKILAPLKGRMRILDYGGGNGVFAAKMNALGFDTVSYDPVYQDETAPISEERFQLIHCREVIEHAPDPRAFARDILRYLADDGAVYLSTALQPEDVHRQVLNWWYLAPRNGHISLFSKRSLARLWIDLGMEFGCFNDYVHLASRGKPPCLALLMEHGGS